MGLLSYSFSLIAPYISKLFIDKAFINKDLTKFIDLSITGVAIFIFSILIKTLNDVIKNRISIKTKFNLANKFMRKIYSLELAFFQDKSVGENIYRFSDTERISDFLLEQCPSVFADIIKLPVILGISLWLNFQMTIFLLVLSPLFLFHSLYLQKRLRPIYEKIWRYAADLWKEVNEAFSKILIIKALGLEPFQRHSYLKSLIKNIRWRIKSFRWSVISSLSSSFLSKAIYGAITLYGGFLVIRGRLSLGSYTAVMIYLTQLGGTLQSLSSRFEYFVRELVSLEKFLEIMDREPGIKDLPGAILLKSIEGEICFDNVWFGYEEKRPVLRSLNLKIPSGKWIGIVGPSGCGKTTLINLVLRLYEPWEGKIFIGNVDLKRIKLKSLREHIAIATQEPLLFDVSIRDNISYGLREVSQEDIEEAAKIVLIHNYIQQLPQGYNTGVGEDACKLSQGQKQRIAIARAILRRPDLLILDEATSSVDSRTEEKIFKILREKRKGLTTIIISHRLFSIKDADRIYFLREDGIIEEGRHSDLLAESYFYREFFQNQIEEKLQIRED